MRQTLAQSCTWADLTDLVVYNDVPLSGHANPKELLATLNGSYGSLVAERLFSPQPSAISGGVFSPLALSIFYLAMELWYTCCV